MATYGGADLSEWQTTLDAGFWIHVKNTQGPIATIQAWGGGPTGWGTNDYVQHQSTLALQAGMDISSYVLLHWNNPAWPGNVQVAAGLDALGPDLVKHQLFVAIDIETHTGWATSGVQYRIPRVLEAIDEVRRRGLFPIIYSSLGMWNTIMSGTPQDWGLIVNQCPYWYAHYDNVDNFSDAPNFAKPWYGISPVVGKQYGGGSALGDAYDLNIWDQGFIHDRRAERDARLNPPVPTPIPPTPEPTPPPVDVYTKAEVDALVAGLNAKIDTVSAERSQGDAALDAKIEAVKTGLRNAGA